MPPRREPAAIPGIVPGHRDKYARVERERRFLLAGPPQASDVVAERIIIDRYLAGTRLRLRQISSPQAGPREYKLTQKVPAAGPGAAQGLITNFYLSEAEYRVLAQLPAAPLRKRRLTVPPYVVDVFGPPRRGLFLAEAEFGTDAELAACPPPNGALAEVTSDPRFTGGRLAVTGRRELLSWLAEFGIRLNR